jgi:hypothetical protein
MAHSPAQILESIPGFVAAKDATSLVALQDHEDKRDPQVRAQGDPHPAQQGRGDPRRRGDPHLERRRPRGPARRAQRGAMLDTGDSTPGLTASWSPRPGREPRLPVGRRLTGRDQVANFTAYVQTDGQRGRLVREWAKDFKGRQVPADWARARIRWAREQTLSTGFSVPNQLDDMLVHLGPAPPSAPGASSSASFRLASRASATTSRAR